MSRDRKLQPGRVLCFRLASLGPLISSVAEKLKDSDLLKRCTYRRGPLGIDLRLLSGRRSMCCQTLICGLARPMGAASICLLHGMLVSL